MSLLKRAGKLVPYDIADGTYRYFLTLDFNIELGASEKIREVYHNGVPLYIDERYSSTGASWVIGGPYPSGIKKTVDDELVVVIETKWPPTVLAAGTAVAQNGDQSSGDDTAVAVYAPPIDASDTVVSNETTAKPTASSPKKKSKKTKSS